MKITQINLTDWMETERQNQKKNPIQFIELPFSVSYIEGYLNLSFDKYQEMGLGDCYSCFIMIDDQEIHLNGFVDRDSEAVGVIVEIHSHETRPDEILNKVCTILKIKKTDLRWVNTNIKVLQELMLSSRVRGVNP